MKIVKRYETEDGKIFDCKLQAEKHEVMIALRGIIQSNGLGKEASPTAILTNLVEDFDKTYSVLSSFKKKYGAIKGAQKRAIG